MTELVFFLEERSAKEMLQGLLPKFLPDNIFPIYVVFQGKQDLEKQLPVKLKGWSKPNTVFIVMRDQDSGDCLAIKQSLVQKCVAAGKPDVLVRIACHELESWYLGDLQAVENAIGPSNISNRQQRYRSPDDLSNPSQALKRISSKYQKISGSRAIGEKLNIDDNRSRSFNVFIAGIRQLTHSLEISD